MRFLASLLGLALFLAGCNSPDEDADDGMGMGDGMGMDDGMGMMDMGPGSYRMMLSGVPMEPMAPGAKFNVTVQAMAGMQGMHAMPSDHIGAHHWNITQADPSAALANATACAHQAGDLPGTYTALCQAPMQPGTYHLRAHARMMDSDQQMHHWWSDEQTFTVA